MRRIVGWMIALLMMCGSAVAAEAAAALVHDMGNHARGICAGPGGEHG